MLLIVVNW